MNEADLKDALVRKLRDEFPAAVVLRHEDSNTAGIPDISFTGRSYTTWFEVKHLTSKKKSRGRGLQKLTCLRLSIVGRCWYVVYQEKEGKLRTLIAQPSEVSSNSLDEIPDERMSDGFDHSFVVSFIRRTHDYVRKE